MHARNAFATHGDAARSLVDLVEMSPLVLGRALLPFPKPVLTLDALHLATLEFLRAQGLACEIATYDQRLADAAAGLGSALAAC